MLKQRPGWRRQLYVVIPAVTAILQTYGLLTEEQASVWASLAISLLGLWLAWSHPLESAPASVPGEEDDVSAPASPVVKVIPTTAEAPQSKVTVQFHPHGGVVPSNAAPEETSKPGSEE